MKTLMRYYCKFLLGFFSLLMPFAAMASGDGDLWVGPVAMVCIAQNPALSATPMGAKVANNRQLAQAVDSMKNAGAACLESRQWISAELCNELLNQAPQAKLQASSLYEKYGAEISGLNELFSCMSPKNGQNSTK